MGSKTILDTRVCRVEQIGEQFVSFNFKGNTDHTIEEVGSFISLLIELMDHKPFVVYNDLRNNYGGISKEIREFIGSHPGLIKYKHAEALMINSLGIRLQVNFYLQFNVEKMKYKVFSSEEKAMKWLLDRQKEIL